VLSMVPLDSVVFHHPVPIHAGGDADSVRRGIQEVTLHVAGRSFRFLHLHLKSRYTSDPNDPQSERFRAAEIIALADFLGPWLSSYGASSHLFLTGDFNTPFSSPLLNPLRPSWQAIPAYDSLGQPWTYSFHRDGSLERIDGFWAPSSSPDAAASISSWLAPFPSDHRLVLLLLPGTS